MPKKSKRETIKASLEEAVTKRPVKLPMAPVDMPVRKNPIQIALDRKAFGKHEDHDLRWVVENDLFWLHAMYRRSLVNNYGSPADLAIKLLCMHYPLGLEDDPKPTKPIEPAVEQPAEQPVESTGETEAVSDKPMDVAPADPEPEVHKHPSGFPADHRDKPAFYDKGKL